MQLVQWMDTTPYRSGWYWYAESPAAIDRARPLYVRVIVLWNHRPRTAVQVHVGHLWIEARELPGIFAPIPRPPRKFPRPHLFEPDEAA